MGSEMCIRDRLRLPLLFINLPLLPPGDADGGLTATLFRSRSVPAGPGGSGTSTRFLDRTLPVPSVLPAPPPRAAQVPTPSILRKTAQAKIAYVPGVGQGDRRQNESTAESAYCSVGGRNSTQVDEGRKG